MKITKKVLSVILCFAVTVTCFGIAAGKDFFNANAADCGMSAEIDIDATNGLVVEAGSRFEFTGSITYTVCDEFTTIDDKGMGQYLEYDFVDINDEFNSVYGSKMSFSGITVGVPMNFMFTLPDELVPGKYDLNVYSMSMNCVTHDCSIESMVNIEITIVNELPEHDEPSTDAPSVTEKHEHTEGYKAIKTAATCTADGELGVYCGECGICYDIETIAAKGHSNTVSVTTSPATCTADGEKVTYCESCGLKTGVTAIPAEGHDAGYWTVDYEATVDHAGQKVLLCTKCDSVLDTEEIAAHTHDGEETVEIRPATCTQDGIEARYCVGCGSYYDMKAIDSTGHGETYAVTSKAPDCTTTGEKTLYCSVCNEAVATETIAALGHDEGVWTVSKAATCTTAGEEIKKCTACGEVTEKKAVDATDHIPGKWEITKDSTCTSSGLKQQTCAVCDALLGEAVVIEPHDHQPGEWVTAFAAGCEKEGEKIKSCTVCKGVLETKVIEATGHNYSAWYKNNDSTHSKDCSACGTTQTANCEYTDTVTAATCTEGGYTTHVCDDCGYTYIDTYTDALGHNWNEWSDNSDGTHSRTCSACNEKETAEHSWSEWVYNEDGTLFKNGTKTRICHDCNSSETEEASHTTWLCQVFYPVIVFVGNIVHKLIYIISLNWFFPELTIYPTI